VNVTVPSRSQVALLVSFVACFFALATAPAGAAVVRLSTAAATVDEDAGQIDVTIVTSGENPVTFDYHTQDVTATAGSDYRATSGAITVPAAASGPASAVVTVPIIDDGELESDETFLVRIESADAGADVEAPSEETVTIHDTSRTADLQLSEPSQAVTESTARVVVGVVRSGSATGTSTVRYSTGGGTAVEGADYVPASGSLTFAPGDRYEHIVVELRQDTVADGTRTFSIALDDASPNARIVAPLSETITIVDDDAPGLLRFNQAGLTASEDQRTVAVAVVRSGGVSGPAAVSWHSRGVGYDRSGVLHFAAGQVAATFLLPIVADGRKRPDVKVKLSLSGAQGAELGAPATATLTVKDTDAPPPGKPTVKVKVARVQHSTGHPGVEFRLRPNSRQRVTGTGTLTFAGGARLKLKTVRGLMMPGRDNKLVVPFAKGTWKRIGQADRKGRLVRAVVTLKLRDPIDRVLTVHRTVRVMR
jgi:hypothetical protein